MIRRALLAASALVAPIPSAWAQTVATASGSIAGSRTDGVEAFRGIPYARPPIGDLRWRAPAAPVSWKGVRRADALGPDCMQSRPAAAAATMSEDCLTINVWRPAGTRATRRLPVIVWIHGGAYVAGGSSDPQTWGDAFARQGIILVTFNYRLGRLGFFSHPALLREQAGSAVGNYGLMDQIAALQWVKRNIVRFGGDPANVTAMGESAGGESVLILAGSPMAQGLFAKAIVQSGGGRDPLLGRRLMSTDLPDRVSAERAGLNFAASVDIAADDPDSLAKLRKLPAGRVADQSMLSLVVGGLNSFAGPIEDGRLFVATTDGALEKRRRAIPILIGTTSADLGLGRAPSKDAAFAAFGTQSDAARRLYDPDGSLPLAQLNMQIAADRVMAVPARLVSVLAQKQGAPAWRFRFDYVADAARSKEIKGAEHASDVAYAFGTLGVVLKDKVTARDVSVERAMQAYWVNFARTGNPNGPGLALWSPEPSVLTFRPDAGVASGPDDWKMRLDLSEATSVTGK